MGYINNDTFKTTAKLTPYGKNKIFLQGFKDLIIKFSVGDSDANYLTDEKNDEIYHYGGDSNASIFDNINVEDMLVYDSTGTSFKNIETSNNIIGSKYITKKIGGIIDTYQIYDMNTEFDIYKTIKQPITTNEKNQFIDGNLSNTILKDFVSERILLMKINNFSDIINGVNFKLSVDDVDIFTAYNSTTLNADNTLFDDSPLVTNISNNMALLFSDEIKKPKGMDELSWSTGFMTFKPYSKNLKSFYNYNDKDLTISDKMVGYILLDQGIVVITNQDLINKFSNESDITYETYTEKVAVYNEIICQINRNEFNSSRNSTYVVGNKIKASEIGLYDSSNRMIALAKFNKQIELTGTQPVTISIVLSL